MRSVSRTRSLWVALIVCLVTAAVVAQSEKVSIRMSPLPNQSIRMTMLQEMDIEILFDGTTGLLGPMKMATRSTLSMTQKTGAAAPNGTLEAQITYDAIRIETSMNGQTLPIADAGNNSSANRLLVTYNRNGEIVDVRGLPAGGLAAESFKQMLNSFYGSLPVAALGMGEVTRVPLDFTFPLPLGAGPVTMSGENTLKLATIENDGKSRTARFESTIDGKVSSTLPTPDPSGTMSLDLTMQGSGRMVTDLENRFIRSNESQVTFDGTIKSTAEPGPTPLPGMTMRGTIKISITGSN